MAALVGFCGSRHLPASFAPAVGRVVAAVLSSGRGVAVGCAPGADALVRQAAPGAVVFPVASGRWGSGRRALAARSAALVRAVAASGPGAAFVGFVAAPCPPGVVPARSWRSGSPPSGSWSTLALAAGRGLPVTAFWYSCSNILLPNWPGGRWQQTEAEGWAWSPLSHQAALW
jgi:hypothetical protein